MPYIQFVKPVNVGEAVEILDGIDLVLGAHVIDEKFGKEATASYFMKEGAGV